jgi:hypothetical protein
MRTANYKKVQQLKLPFSLKQKLVSGIKSANSLMSDNGSTKKGFGEMLKRDEVELPRGGNLYPYAGMIRVRFNGYDLSPLYADTPQRFRAQN